MVRLISGDYIATIYSVASTNSQIRASRCIFPINYIPYLGLLASTTDFDIQIQTFGCIVAVTTSRVDCKI